MKHLIGFLFVFCLFAGTNVVFAQTAKNNGSEIKIKTSAQCEMCKDAIEKAMSFEKGIKTAVLDVDSKVLTIVYKPSKTNPQKLREAVAKVGYDADEVPAVQASYDKLPDCCKKGGH